MNIDRRFRSNELHILRVNELFILFYIWVSLVRYILRHLLVVIQILCGNLLLLKSIFWMRWQISSHDRCCIIWYLRSSISNILCWIVVVIMRDVKIGLVSLRRLVWPIQLTWVWVVWITVTISKLKMVRLCLTVH